MLDINSILENETIKGALGKVGVSPDQAKGFAEQAMSSLKTKFSDNPKQMSSLLSDNPNTPEDESLKAEVEEDFLSRLTSKVGLPDNIANQLKGAMPDIMNQFSSKLNEKGANNESGIAGMFGSVSDWFDGDLDNDGKKDTSGIGGMINKLFGK